MNPTVIRILGVIAMVAPILIDCVVKYANKQPIDWNMLIATISSALGGSQVIKRLDDTSAKHVEAKVDAKVAEILNTVPPPGAQ